MSQKLEKRMYFLTMYNLSDIQKGIQPAHAVVEYHLKYPKSSEYFDWARNYKTIIILNGGTSNAGRESKHKSILPGKGTMEMHLKFLKKNKIKCAHFYEPDLNNSLSAIAFIVDETVFNKKKYPDWDPNSGIPFSKFVKKVGKKTATLKEFLKDFRLA